MNPNDPFFALGGERTIIKPRLGKPASHAIQSLDNILGPSNPASSSSEMPDVQAQASFDQMLHQLQANPPASKNKLLVHAGPLLRLIGTVSELSNIASTKALSAVLSKGLTELDQKLELAGCAQAERLSVRYMLCTFMDEKAASTPWGGSGQWANHSLLLQFFSETWGGEKVFALIQKLMQNPSDNRNLLEVAAVILSFGFKGKYKVEQGGDIALTQLKSRLFHLVQPNATESQGSLHPEFWESKAPRPNRRILQIPLWLPVSALSTLGALFFIGLYFNMNSQSDQAFAEIASIQFPAPQFPQQIESAPVQATQGLELPSQLREEIIAGLVTLKQIANKSTVILTGDGLFNSGSADLNESAIPLVEKVAKELALHPGQITVTGYTDNQPIRSIRFPSNWQLSAERAEHVGQRIAAFLPNTAIATEGAGAANPIAPNDTAQGRAKNRRVEITLIHNQ